MQALRRKSEKDGWTDIHYTLVVHPNWADRVEEYWAMLERNPQLGGLFSPPRDEVA